MDSTPGFASGAEPGQAALGYLQRFNWPVFPVCSPSRVGRCHEHGRCDKPGKKPLVEWKPYQDTLPTEVEITAWWRKWPRANIGLVTGHLSKVVVIDLDGHVAQQEAAKRGYQPGPWSMTGRDGGVHRFFAHRDDAPRNFVKRGGVDFRGEAGFVILPPSKHVDGPVYTWGLAPTVDQVWPRLEYWIDEVAAQTREKARHDDFKQGGFEPIDIEWLLEHGVPEGQRDDVLFRVSARCRGEDMAVEDAYTLVLRIANVCQPPFPEQEARAKVDSAYRRYTPNPEPIRIGRLTRHAAVDVEDDEGRVLYAVPPFPDKVMPPPLRALALATSLPTPLVAGAGLSVLAICVGGESEFVLHETQRERAILWLALLGRNGVGKSPSMDLVYQALVDLDDKAYLRFLEDRAAYNALDAAAKKQTVRPTDPRMLRSSLSGAALLRQLGVVSDTGLKLDELSTTLRRLQTGRDGQSLIDPGELLKSWSGEGISYTRVGTGKNGGNDVDLYVPRPTVTMCGDLQTFLHPLLGSDTDGMRVRWLPHQWEEPWRQARQYPSATIVQAWKNLVQRLVNRRKQPRAWHVERRERRLIDELTVDWMTRADNAPQATYQAALLKADRQTMRVALVLAEAEADEVDGPLYIDTRHIEAAAVWVEYCLRVWLALGDAETLSISRENQAMDPAVERIRIYIEQQGDIDPQTERRFVTAKRLLNHGVAGVKDTATRDRAAQRYGAFYPGCVVERQPPGGGTKTVVLWAPLRRRNDPSTDDFDPSTAPFNPSTDPSTDLLGPLEPVDRPVDRPVEPVDRPPKPVDRRVLPDEKARRAPARARVPTTEAVEKKARAKAEKELARLEAADAAAPKLDYITVLTNSALPLALAKLGDTFGLDTETNGLDSKRDRLRTINLSDGTAHIVIDTWAVSDLVPLQRKLRAAHLYMHTFLFDLAFLAQVNITIDPSRIVDVRTQSVLLEAEQKHVDFSLQGIAKRRLAEHVDKAEQKHGWDVPDLRHAKLAYAAEDARITYEVGERLNEVLLRRETTKVLLLERDVQAPMWWMASAGVPADRTIMAEAVAEQENLVAGNLEFLNELAGSVSVNWRSPKQVLPILQSRGLQVAGTGEDALMDAESEDSLISALLGYRSAGACLGLLRKAQASISDDGRIYAAFHPMGAVTGRMSCSEPNLQNLPHETRAREAIRPGPGRVFVRADYSQLQLVIAAHISHDQEMLRILNLPDGDIHQRTADAVGCTRSEAKAVNFGFLFGAQAATFRREQRKHGVYMTELQAFEYRKTFMETYEGIADWHDGQAGWNRPVLISDPSGSGRTRRRVESKNMQLNTPVQMVEAHGFKRALVEIYESRAEVPSARLVMPVHDELIVECDTAVAEECKLWLVGCMLQGMQPLLEGVRVRVDAKVVRSYADADK